MNLVLTGVPSVQIRSDPPNALDTYEFLYYLDGRPPDSLTVSSLLWIDVTEYVDWIYCSMLPTHPGRW